MLRRIRLRQSVRKQRTGYRSRFGGLWTDRPDANDALETRLGGTGSAPPLDASLEPQLRHWIERGYVVLPGAVDPEVCDRLRSDVHSIWDSEDESYLVEVGPVRHPLRPSLRSGPYKLLDLHARNEDARSALFADPIRRFLRTVFERDPLLFQSLTFETGSTQPIHQDTAYVVTTRPMELAAVWIALEDIQPGTGELMYYPGSHRFPEHVFKGGARNWNARRDGEEAHHRYLEDLHAKAESMGLELEAFLPRKGDALIWSADLAHGGGEITQTGATRWSLVGHFCPDDVEPYYFSYRPRQRRLAPAPGGGQLASAYYRV
ncbi:MAG: phytanoyl-CoA dioxygenase family protein [Planctomycetota bacterium]